MEPCGRLMWRGSPLRFRRYPSSAVDEAIYARASQLRNAFKRSSLVSNTPSRAQIRFDGTKGRHAASRVALGDILEEVHSIAPESAPTIFPCQRPQLQRSGIG